MKTLADIEHLEGVKVLVRVDFNVPVTDGVVTDNFRIQKALPTIQFLQEKKAKIILISHIEEAESKKTISSGPPSLEPVVAALNKLGLSVAFIADYKKAHEYIEQKLGDGECVLLENLRYFEGEKNNDKKFSEELASLGDIYVNDAFSVSHREHASIVSVPTLLPSYAGLQFEQEVTHLSHAFDPSHPFLFVLGGAKFDTKLPLIQRFLSKADTLFIGGALANDALKARGLPIGASKVSNGKVDIGPVVNQPNVHLPVDVLVQDHTVKNVAEVGAMDAIYDAGPQTLKDIGEKIAAASFILWNGPLGLFEKGFTEGTYELARLISERTTQGNGKVVSIVGGGDTLAAIATLKIEDSFTFVSTGGGAMLDFLAKGSLPGIDALKK